ncbi:MAG: translation initiation factor IF-3 [Buchnera aphidicola (Nurudea yanoniella)]
MKGGKKIQITKPNRINHSIRAAKVRLTDFYGKPVGIVTLEEALNKAKEVGVDLVEISPNSEPPVCRIMNYGKFLYQKSKSIKKQKKKQRIINVKEVKFRPGTDESDYRIKLKNLIRFLNNGDKVKITLRFRGREMVHQQIGIKVLSRVKNDLKDFSVIETFPSRIEGRQMIMILAPKKK